MYVWIYKFVKMLSQFALIYILLFTSEDYYLQVFVYNVLKYLWIICSFIYYDLGVFLTNLNEPFIQYKC